MVAEVIFDDVKQQKAKKTAVVVVFRVVSNG